MRRLLLCLAAAAAIVGGGETAVRIAGLVDFPLYEANNRIGYILKPNQSGSFMNSHDWAFNEISMGTARRFAPSEKTDVLLIGDSLVLGGNPYRQEDRLGPQLETVSGDVIWPISAGSWGIQNELEYLTEHPEVVASVDRIVFLVNSGDFDKPSSWALETTHPTHPPFSALWYLIEKNVIKPKSDVRPEMLVQVKEPYAEFQRFASNYSKPIDMWLYPDKPELADPALLDQHFSPIISKLQSMNLSNVTLHYVKDIEGWKPEFYRDGIHPSPEGTKALAKAIAGENG